MRGGARPLGGRAADRAPGPPARWAAWLATVLVAAAAVAGAQEGSLDPRDVARLGPPAGPPIAGAELAAATHEVASMMRCPVCQGLSVADSHTPSALAMRVKAEALLAAGYSREQVLGYFEASYGEFIRLAPRAEGFNLVVWILPGVGLLIGALLVWRRLRKAPGRAAGGAAEAPEEADLAAYRERVRQEVEG
jgi:cytochrome c-type biogenesis protein CcmH